MRKSVLVLVGCLVLCAAPAWAGGAFSLFGTYGEVTESSRAFGAGARLSFGGQSVMVELTRKCLKLKGENWRHKEREVPKVEKAKAVKSDE